MARSSNWLLRSGLALGLVGIPVLAPGSGGSTGAAPPVRRIGVLFWHDSPNDALAFEGFRKGLEVSGLPHRFDVRRSHSSVEEARRHLDGWIAGSFDLVLALGTSAAQIARERVHTLPVVYTAVTNPVLSGIADGWDSSGGNLAGNSNWIPAETLLRAFRRAVPGLRTLGVISSRSNQVPAAEIRMAREALTREPAPGLSLEVAWVEGESDLAPAAERLAARVEAIWIPIDILVYDHLDLIRKATDPLRIPLLSSSQRAVEEGAVVSLLVDYRKLGKQAAGIAIRILEDGVDPSSIPVGTLQGYRTIVNLKRARKIGYRLPLEVLCTADRLIR